MREKNKTPGGIKAGPPPHIDDDDDDDDHDDDDDGGGEVQCLAARTKGGEGRGGGLPRRRRHRDKQIDEHSLSSSMARSFFDGFVRGLGRSEQLLLEAEQPVVKRPACYTRANCRRGPHRPHGAAQYCRRCMRQHGCLELGGRHGGRTHRVIEDGLGLGRLTGSTVLSILMSCV